MSEQKDYKKFKDYVTVYGDRIDRIENVMVLGMPDVNYCAEGTEAWIEIKSPKEPKKAITPLFGSNHKLSIDQKNWFLRQKKAGGIGLILIATDKRWILMDGCIYADYLNEYPVSALCEYSIWNNTIPFPKTTYTELRREIINTKILKLT
jgi:hypothetical protein